MTEPIRTNPTITKTTDRAARAACHDCAAAWDKPNALAPAARHAKAHGHRVTGWLSVDVTYDGRVDG